MRAAHRRRRIGLEMGLARRSRSTLVTSSETRGAAGVGRRAARPGAPARRAARRRQGRGARRRRGRPRQARRQGPAAPARAGHGASQERKDRLERIRKALGDAEPRRRRGPIAGHHPGQGHPPDRGHPAAPDADRQRDHRPPRAAGGRGDQPALDLDLVERPFFEALDEVARQGRGHDLAFTGDGSVGITGGQAAGEGARSSTSGRSGSLSSRFAERRDFQAGTAIGQRRVRGRLGAATRPDAPGAQGRRAGRQGRSGARGRSPRS